MFDSWWWLSVPAMALLWLSWKNNPKNLRLDWNTLSTFLRDPTEYEVIQNVSDGGLNADFGIQFRSASESVKYFITVHPGQKVETVDLFRPGYAGFIVTFVNSEVYILQRVAGRTTRKPQLQPQEYTALEGLLKRVRIEAEKYRS